MKRRNQLIGLVAIAVAAYALYPKSRSQTEVADDGGGLIFDRIWMEKAPEKQTDYVHAFYAVDGQAMGLFINASSYDFHFERFDYDKGKGKLNVTFPQTEKKGEIAYTIKKCNDLPQFDLCLDIKANPWGGPKRYYASTESSQDAKGAPEMRARIRALLP